MQVRYIDPQTPAPQGGLKLEYGGHMVSRKTRATDPRSPVIDPRISAHTNSPQTILLSSTGRQNFADIAIYKKDD